MPSLPSWDLLTSLQFNSLKLNTKNDGGEKDIPCASVSEFNRHMSTGLHSNNKPGVGENKDCTVSLSNVKAGWGINKG